MDAQSAGAVCFSSAAGAAASETFVVAATAAAVVDSVAVGDGAEADTSEIGSVAVKAPPHWAKALPTDAMVSVAEQ